MHLNMQKITGGVYQLVAVMLGGEFTALITMTNVDAESFASQAYGVLPKVLLTTPVG
jgi:hypothetical protein